MTLLCLSFSGLTFIGFKSTVFAHIPPSTYFSNFPRVSHLIVFIDIRYNFTCYACTVFVSRVWVHFRLDVLNRETNLFYYVILGIEWEILPASLGIVSFSRRINRRLLCKHILTMFLVHLSHKLFFIYLFLFQVFLIIHATHLVRTWKDIWNLLYQIGTRSTHSSCLLIL